MDFWKILNSHNKKSTSISLGNTNFSYLDLLNRINDFSYELKNKGIKKDSKVILYLHNDSFFIFVFFALWKIGAVPIPLNLRLTSNELNYQIDFVEADFIICNKINTSKFNKYPNIIFVENLIINKNKVVNFDNSTQNSSTALILFTSGTSKSPKAVELTFNNLLSSAKNAVEFLDIINQDILLASLPFFHIGGILILIRAFISGASVRLINEINRKNIINEINNATSTIISLVPTVLNSIVNKRIASPEKLKWILLGGAFADEILLKEALKLNYNIVKVYGSTETSAFVTAIKLNENPNKINSVGKPLKNNRIEIVKLNDDNFAAGEIKISGPVIAKGYYKPDIESKNKFKDNFYFTGDIGFIDNDEFLHLEIRRSDLIISGGENINPIEIENEILNIKSIKEVAVVGIYDEIWGEVPAAFLVLKSINNILEEDIIHKIESHLQINLAKYKIPKKYFFVNKIPKTELGKIKKHELKNIIKN